MSQGYIRFPHIHRDHIVFVAEDDLWLISSEGGRAERLTAGVGEASHPRFSPSGQQLAFVGHEEGPREVYVMSAAGGEARRLTFQSASCSVLGWTPSGEEILYASNAGQYTPRYQVIFAVRPGGGLPRQLPVGMANALTYGPEGGVVLGRNIREPAHWKRYRGGTVGHLWCDSDGGGNFRRLLDLQGNIASPCWVEGRIYFLSDHAGVGNIYSCTPQGEDVRRHTEHQDFYARNLASDGQRLVYHAGGDLYIFDPADERPRRIQVELPSLRAQLNRKFVAAGKFINSYALHPQGHAVALTTRGKAFSMGNWEGPTLQHGERDGVRYRLLEWLNDGKRLVAISDQGGREALVIFDPGEAHEPRLLEHIEFGRAITLAVSPGADAVALTNHRNELLYVDIENGTSSVVDRSEYERITDIAWSPDGGWLAYSFANSLQTCAIKLWNMASGEIALATEPVLRDVAPSFDPDGNYLYFLGHRTFNPVRDNFQFEYSFPKGVRPYAILLRHDQRSPFMPEIKSPRGRERDTEATNPKKAAPEGEANGAKQAGAADATGRDSDQEDGKKAVAIDLEGITTRALPFPIPEGRFHAIHAVKGKALLLGYPLEGSIHSHEEQFESRGSIYSYDFETLKYEWLMEGVNDFDISRNAKWVVYQARHRLRVLKAGEKAPKPESHEPNRENGWLDLHRVKVSVQPAAEWRQMFDEAWRLQREHFWAEDMAGIDWRAVHEQYAPLVERVSSRSELSDLLWELQGELGTSHAYEMGGEYRQGPHYQQGFLGVDWSYDGERQRYRVARIVEGESSSARDTSPLAMPGMHVRAGDAIVAVNGQRVAAGRSPQELLVNQADVEVQLTIEDAESRETRVVTVKALAEERPARYREWVEATRQRVHSLSRGQVGYIYIPDMGPRGYAEFHRGFLSEFDFPALLIDVRWNGGGNVSGLLLEKLARRRLGYDFPRWGKPLPYPMESARGPMVALTNEHAGSDGDMFCHAFKLMGLGPLVGVRTWGGVIGISPNHRLVDGTSTTQPEFAFWFKDVGWNIENYGTDPDIEVDIAPQDYLHDSDPQLERAIAEALRLIPEHPYLEPKPGARPRHGREPR
jgi:tricorn protease